MNSEDKRAMLFGIPLIIIGILMLFYFNIKDHKDFINNCKQQGGTIIYQDYPQRTYCNLESKGE